MLSASKKDALRRMKIIQGQVAKVIKMIEEENYCPDIMTQSLAVQNAMKEVDAKLLEGHLKTCVQRQMKSGDSDRAVSELVKIFRLSKKS